MLSGFGGNRPARLRAGRCGYQSIIPPEEGRTQGGRGATKQERLDAFKKTEQYRKGEKIAGLTPIQRFFLGYALGWLSQEREASLRRNLLSDVHAPAKWRVLGPLSNIPEFYEAFGVKPREPMWRPADARVKIW